MNDKWDLTKAVLPLATVMAIIVGLFSGYLYLESKFDAAAAQVQIIRDKINQNSNDDQRKFDALGFQNQNQKRIIELWISEFARQNPSLDVPKLPEK